MLSGRHGVFYYRKFFSNSISIFSKKINSGFLGGGGCGGGGGGFFFFDMVKNLVVSELFSLCQISKVKCIFFSAYGYIVQELTFGCMACDLHQHYGRNAQTVKISCKRTAGNV